MPRCSSSIKKCAMCKQCKPKELLFVDPRFTGCYCHPLCSACANKVIERNTHQCKQCKTNYLDTDSYDSKLCPLCRSKDRATEYQRWHHARRRLSKEQFTLTFDEWMDMLHYFQGMCAYCLVRPFGVLEHFVPSPYGDTSRQNCVPSCVTCNCRKGPLMPHEAINKYPEFREPFRRVAAYLGLSMRF